MPDPATLVWFKRDLRMTDHSPLAAAIGPVIPLYIAEPEMWAHPDAAGRQWAFVAESLNELRASLAALGAPLIVRTGEAVAVLDALRRAHPIAALRSHEETGLLWSWERDKRVAAWAARHGIPWTEQADSGVVRRLASRDGWAQRREALMRQPLIPAPKRLQGTGLAPGAIPTAAQLGLTPDPCPLRQTGGRTAGEEILTTFLHDRGEQFPTDMSSPVTGETGCSRLSPHLAWGTISPREAQQAAMARAAETRGQGTGWPKAMRSFVSRLAWRDHFTQKLEDFPRLDRDCLHSGMEGLRPRVPEGDTADRLAAFAEGRTGLPFVDACMRYAQATGWLNFRMRAMVQCVASYHLWLDHRDSGPVLARLWTDYAPGIHWAQSQMQSGTTGINQLRIYNPVKQGHDQDPTGAFTRRWVPELAHLEGRELQEPWRAASPPAGYPAPLVDPVAAAKEARSRVYAHRRGDAFREEAQRIAAKHGSRKGGRRGWAA
ncbi:FAD-binding domain-containing protein [Jannaschia seohaensis]|uniref:Deoxyribodipyrimidine photo-lyase n=1 Tax=Jannaschia seohaensis TaxID=475081 RepID=A0A2Y9AN73_9RHOB|nr:FAD-binding domain-containing protein [Jannaschia seohaensis]PWJ19259.1 deoxyribodipyrimidine photo-lyase [Jannaschia seohaensis]SSA45921.1 deoxyribodipyrimidine photo-lyase [Jannaschia seohaensis]